jgi:hypothetical protein
VKVQLNPRNPSPKPLANQKKPFSNRVSLSLSLHCNFTFHYMNLSNNFADFFFLKFVESPAEFFAENKNIAGFDNVRIVI